MRISAYLKDRNRSLQVHETVAKRKRLPKKIKNKWIILKTHRNFHHIKFHKEIEKASKKN